MLHLPEASWESSAVYIEDFLVVSATCAVQMQNYFMNYTMFQINFKKQGTSHLLTIYETLEPRESLVVVCTLFIV